MILDSQKLIKKNLKIIKNLAKNKLEKFEAHECTSEDICKLMNSLSIVVKLILLGEKELKEFREISSIIVNKDNYLKYFCEDHPIKDIKNQLKIISKELY